jgi:hypothetical protein
LSTFDEFHAEVTGAITFADFVDGDDAGVIKAGRRFRFPTKPLQVPSSRPMTKANHFESNRAVQAFLPRSINHTLAAAADYLQQLVIAKIREHL